MTPEQREQWNLFACVPRCIIALAARRGKALSDEQFAARFAPKVAEWKNRFGLTRMRDALDIIAELELAVRAVKIPNTQSFIEFINSGHTLDYALVLTHRHRSPETGEFIELHHCRLLLGFEPETPNLLLHNPSQDGNEYVDKESIDSLTEQQAEFIVLYRLA